MGFFHVVKASKSDRAETAIRNITTSTKLGCDRCSLNKAKCVTPKMRPDGGTKPLIYMLGKSPTEADDAMGSHMVSKSGQLIRNVIPSKFNKAIRWNNIVRCRTPNGRAPSSLELNCCRQYQIDDIAKSQPKAVVGFGGEVLEWMLGEGGQIKLWRGRRLAMSLGGHEFWFYPMLDPSFVSHQRDEKGGNEWMRVFVHDLKVMFADAEDDFGDDPICFSEAEARANVIIHPKTPVHEMEKIITQFCRENPEFGFDLETTGLNQHASDFEILTFSIGTDEEAHAFPLGHPEARLPKGSQDKLKSRLALELMKAKKVVAHNAAFEQGCIIQVLGEDVARKIKWADTQAQAFTLDERRRMHSLDTLCRIHFNVPLKSLSDVDVKNIRNEPLGKVLPYNGMDAKFCYMLDLVMHPLLSDAGLLPVSAMHERRSLTMALLKSRGLVPDIKAARKFDVVLGSDTTKLQKKIMNTPDVKDYIKKAGKFNPGTPEDVLKFFRSLGIFLDNTEEETLVTLTHPLASDVLELRGLIKQHSTYIKPIATGKIIQPDGLIHGTFSQLVASTGRLASDDPNLQNFPSRKHKEIRSVIACPPDCLIGAFDYGQIEARVIGMASKDKVLCKALWEDYDIHSHWAKELAYAYPSRVGGKSKLHDKAAMKVFRTDVKNQWTFPLFFGAQLSSASHYLQIPLHILEPLYNKFWNEFSGVREWQEKLLAFYAKNLYVETLTGRRRHGPLSPNEAINMPIQGTASDVVVDSMERMDVTAEERKEPWLSPRLNVHDDLTFYLPKKKLEESADLIGEAMCLSPYPFINVPITVELKIGTNWAELEEVHVYRSTDYA